MSNGLWRGTCPARSLGRDGLVPTRQFNTGYRSIIGRLLADAVAATSSIAAPASEIPSEPWRWLMFALLICGAFLTPTGQAQGVLSSVLFYQGIAMPVFVREFAGRFHSRFAHLGSGVVTSSRQISSALSVVVIGWCLYAVLGSANAPGPIAHAFRIAKIYVAGGLARSASLSLGATRWRRFSVMRADSITDKNRKIVMLPKCVLNRIRHLAAVVILTVALISAPLSGCTEIQPDNSPHSPHGNTR